MADFNQFLFFPNYWESIVLLEKEQQVEMVYAAVQYGVTGETTEFKKPEMNALFALLRSSIDLQDARKSHAQLKAGGQNSHGGKRKGAGRKPNNQNENQEYLEKNSSIQDCKLNRTDLNGNEMTGLEQAAVEDSGFVSESEARGIVRDSFGDGDFTDDLYQKLCDKGMAREKLAEYVKYLHGKSNSKTIENSKNWFYKCIMDDTLLEEFFQNRKKMPPVASLITCPVCSATHEENRSCSQCGLTPFERSNAELVEAKKACFGLGKEEEDNALKSEQHPPKAQSEM